MSLTRRCKQDVSGAESHALSSRPWQDTLMAELPLAAISMAVFFV